jgi:hypothetical protein
MIPKAEKIKHGRDDDCLRTRYHHFILPVRLAESTEKTRNDKSKKPDSEKCIKPSQT